MKKPDTLQGSLDLLVLTILSRRPKLHGYALMTAIKETSGEVLSPEEGSLYPALHRMEEAGWIGAGWVVKENGKRARIYHLTAAGKKQLAMEEARWPTVSLAINRVLRFCILGDGGTGVGAAGGGWARAAVRGFARGAYF